MKEDDYSDDDLCVEEQWYIDYETLLHPEIRGHVRDSYVLYTTEFFEEQLVLLQKPVEFTRKGLYFYLSLGIKKVDLKRQQVLKLFWKQMTQQNLQTCQGFIKGELLNSILTDQIII